MQRPLQKRLQFYWQAAIAAVQQAAEAIGITHYELSKIQGTRFVSRRDKGYKRFLHLLPALITSFENYEVQAKNADTKAKVSGLLKRSRSSKILNMCAAVDIFGKLLPASLVFEGEGRMAFQVKPTIEMAISELGYMVDKDDAIEIDIMLRFIQFDMEDGAGKTVASQKYCAAGREKYKPQNKEYHIVKIENITGFHDQSLESVEKKLKLIDVDLIYVLNTRFADFNNCVFCSMNWLNPQFWVPSLDYGKDQLVSLYDRFKVPLDEASYGASKVEKE